MTGRLVILVRRVLDLEIKKYFISKNRVQPVIPVIFH